MSSLTRCAATFELAAAAALTIVVVAGCRDKPTANGAGVPDAAKPRASASSVVSTPKPKGSASSPLIPPAGDAGAGGACRLVAGPIQQPWTGPATLVATSRGIELVRHKNGVTNVTVVPYSPLPKGPAQRVTLPAAATETASRPPCAVADKYAFCSDHLGRVHRSLREMASDEIVGEAQRGSRVTAAPLGAGHSAVGYIQRRKTSEGEVAEAWAKVDDLPPMRISEDGAGTSDVVFAPRHQNGVDEIVVWMIDARVSMSPVHARTLSLKDGKVALSPDVVVHIAGGSMSVLQGAIAATDAGVFGLVAADEAQGFGMLSMPLHGFLKEDGPYAFSPYPLGLDYAALSATQRGAVAYVARVRPTGRAEAAPLRDAGGDSGGNGSGGDQPLVVGLELGRLDERGRFAPLGFIATRGPVAHVSLDVDADGSLYVLYNDQEGAWLERRVCSR